MQSALGEGDREGNDFCANLEDRDKETEVLGGALLMLKNGADFLLGPTRFLSTKVLMESTSFSKALMSSSTTEIGNGSNPTPLESRSIVASVPHPWSQRFFRVNTY